MLETPSEILCRYADKEAADSFIAYRKKHKRSALTERGAVMIAKTLREIAAEGGDPTEALDMAQEMGWQSIKAEWYWRNKHGNGNHNAARNPASDTADREISFAAAAIRTPDKDCF
jgi:hypothetical protein